MYLHATHASNDGNFQALKKQFEKKLASLENNIAKMEKNQEAKDAAIKSLNEKCKMLENSLVSIEDLKQDLKSKTSTINGLEIKLEELEKFHQKHNKQHEKKLKDLENSVKQRKSKDVIPETGVENMIKCDKCDYTTSSRQGLKIHTTKTHSKVDFDAFPAACDICEKVLDNEANLKQHKKMEHMFHYVKFQCNECEFMANDPHTFHVHFGIHHTIKKSQHGCGRWAPQPNLTPPCSDFACGGLRDSEQGGRTNARTKYKGFFRKLGQTHTHTDTRTEVHIEVVPT